MIRPVDEQSLAYAAAAPTRVRYWVIVFAVTLAIITYIDRVCISQAAPSIRAELGLSELQMGLAFSAFYWTYALFEIPGGWMGDRWGARRILMRVVVWWSCFTAATGLAWNAVSLVAARALFGAGEAGCFPNLTKTFTTWLPRSERVRAQGLMWLSARWGGALTPLLVLVVLWHLSWRYAFVLFGLVGVVWAVFFYRWYRDNPLESPNMNAAERALIPPASEVVLAHGETPWAAMLSSRSVWFLFLQYMCMNYGWTFYITWLPTYLQEARGLALGKSALLAGVPLFFGGLGSLCCGLLATRLERRTPNVRAIRRTLAMIGLAGASVCLALSPNLPSPVWAVIAMGMASFCNDLAMPPSWAGCMDIGGKVAGTLSGGMNMMGNAANSLAPIVTGFLLARTGHNWAVIFYVSAAVYLAGSFCWLFIDPVTPLERAHARTSRVDH